MDVLLVANGYPPGAMGGVETYAATLAGALRRAGHRVRVFCREDHPSRADGAWRDDELDGVPVRRVTNRFVRVSGFADYYVNDDIEALFLRSVQEWAPDVVHFQHAIGLSARLPLVAAEANVPAVWTLWDYWPICPVNTLLLADGTLCPGSHHPVNCFSCVYGSPRPFPGRHLPPGAATEDGAATVTHPFGLTEATMHRLRRTLPREARLRLLDLYNAIGAARARVTRGLGRANGAGADTEPLPPPAIAYRTALMREALGSCATLVAPLPFVRDTYVEFGLDPDRIRVVEPGMDLSPWPRVPRPARPAGEPLRLGYIGSLMRHKGIDLVLDALERLPDAHLELRLHGFFVPGDPYGALVRRRLGDDARVRWMGPYEPPQLAEILSAVDVLLMPARWHETFSFVSREAMLGGVPVLASDLGGMRYVVRDGQNGRLLSPGDPAAWAEAIGKLAGDRVQLARMSDACRATAVRSIDADAAELLDVYSLATARAGGGP
jgi:glycosyltransferase involved in cell wall biosynthesis